MTTAEISAKIQFINDSFVLDTSQTEFTGKGADTIIQAVSGTNTNKFLYNVFNYTSFKTAILPTSLTPTIAMLKKIYVKDGAADFAPATTLAAIPPATAIPAVAASAAGATPVVAASAAVPAITDAQRAVWKITDGNSLNSEYNYHLLLIDSVDLATPASGTASIKAFGPSFASTEQSLLQLLNNLRIAYNILDESALADYKKNKLAGSLVLDTPIGQYKLRLATATPPAVGTPTGKSDTINNIAAIKTAVTNIINLDTIDVKSTRIHMVRRLLYLYELLIHTYIAAYLLEKTPANSPLRVPFYDILYDTLNMLYKRNEIVDDAGSNLNVILTNLQIEMREYNDNHSAIEEENIKLKKTKVDIMIEKDRLNTSGAYKSKVTNIFYIYLIVLLLVVGGIVMVMLNDTLSDGMKKLFIGLMAGVSILVMVALYLLNRYVIMEPFAGLTTLSTVLEVGAVEGTYAAFITAQTGDDLRKAVYAYLLNTINIGLIVDSYKDYTDMNYSISKEVDYYKDKNNTLKQDKDNISGAHNILDLEAFINRYRIHYFVQLLMTITITALLVTYLPIPGLTTFLMVIAALLIMLFTYMYIINVNNLVHTDARKMYWGKPAEIKNLTY